jgi:hypothetical protein
MIKFSLIPQTPDLLKIRKKIEASMEWAKFTDKERALLESSYKEITGDNPPGNCNGCTIVFTILRNWLVMHDTQPQKPQIKMMKPVNKPTAEVVEEIIKATQDPGGSIIILSPQSDEVSVDVMTLSMSELRAAVKAKGLSLPKGASKKALQELAQ